ncbi:hypothetical protein TI03_07115 [Achromatium sp. WMS1]|nr:hypothetical protein TI03_07115 [Achromatium sp. WMS1]
MAEISKDTAYLIRADLYKTVLTLDLTLMAGAITLLQIIIENGALVVLAYISITMLALSAICALGALETLAALTTPEFVSNNLFSKILGLKSLKNLIFFDSASGMLLGAGLVFLIFFVLAN